MNCRIDQFEIDPAIICQRPSRSSHTRVNLSVMCWMENSTRDVYRLGTVETAYLPSCPSCPSRPSRPLRRIIAACERTHLAASSSPW